MGNISHLSRQCLRGQEEVAGGDAKHRPSGSGESIVPADVVGPLRSLSAVVIALVLDDEAAGGDREVGMQESATGSYGMIDQHLADRQVFQQQPQQ